MAGTSLVKCIAGKIHCDEIYARSIDSIDRSIDRRVEPIWRGGMVVIVVHYKRMWIKSERTERRSNGSVRWSSEVEEEPRSAVRTVRLRHPRHTPCWDRRSSTKSAPKSNSDPFLLVIWLTACGIGRYWGIVTDAWMMLSIECKGCVYGRIKKRRFNTERWSGFSASLFLARLIKAVMATGVMDNLWCCTPLRLARASNDMHSWLCMSYTDLLSWPNILRNFRKTDLIGH